MRISFDFDGTLDDKFGGVSINEQKLEIQSLAKKYINDGHEVIILTKRYGPANSKRGLKNEHLEVYKLAKELGIVKVYFTNREMKFSHIMVLKIDKHFEDDAYEVGLINQVCKERGHDCLVIPVEDKNWRELL
jgi:hypothetical protein